MDEQQKNDLRALVNNSPEVRSMFYKVRYGPDVKDMVFTDPKIGIRQKGDVNIRYKRKIKGR